ncbi:U3 small nucleolar RNA-associated protein 14 [Fasciola hepatica]|uniref:U3 small nucleolar RNA-associated protein 14 n=1 Tax=Fasciola hepatica TaxID=6192 RepID=A0A4E0RLL4_FASHE|nr:U3 small nucleolar RNA-associated protein 14 [Fasciola hepatica]
MESNAPPVEDANVWGLVSLKKGNKRKQQKVLNELRRETKVLEAVDDIRNDKKNRRIAFQGVKRQMTLWKGPVMRNRLSDQLIFPLNDTSVTLINSEESQLMRAKDHISLSKSDVESLQGKLYNAIYQNENSVKPLVGDKVSAEVRKRLMEKLDQREKERFILSRMAARNKRQNKIKSKTFHRHLKGRLLKEFEKQMEDMRMNNPRAFAKRIMKAELNRAKERASLRHRSGGKFGRMQKLRAKYDTEARNAVSEMHEQSRELTKKNNLDDTSESEDSDIDVTSESEPDSDGSLVAESHSSENEEDDATSRKLFWWHSSDNIADRGIKPKAQVHQFPLLSTLAAENTLERCAANKPTISLVESMEQAEPEAETLDPTTEGFYRTLEETCATDPGLQDQFAKEKMEAVEEETPKDLDMFLPGWNAWTGPGLEEADEERRKKHIIPAPKVRRKDSGKSHVLIRRRVNNEFKEHLVKSIPFPYNTPEQFEAVIAQPISREWTTEGVHRELTRPKVTVQAGRIIRPISKSAALLRDKDVERLKKQKKDI